MTCATCGEMGYAKDSFGVLSACYCPAGDAVRAREAIPTLKVPTLVEVAVDGRAAAIAMAASIWCIQNQGRTEDDVDPLPEGVTPDDILAAMARSRIQATRRAIEKHKEHLSTPLPRPEAAPEPDQGEETTEIYTGRAPFGLVVAVIIVVALVVLGGFALADYVAARWGR